MHNVNSPNTSDEQIEQKIQAAGLIAPRIKPEDITAAISSYYFFTAGDAVSASTEASYPKSLNLLTFCVIVLKNGFTVTGESACASPENFNERIGQEIAYENAKQKIWALEGYLLKSKLHQEKVD